MADSRRGLRDMNDTTRQNVTDLIAQLAHAGVDDPTIAATLDVKVTAVVALRREAGIAAGDQRWIGRRLDGYGEAP